MAATQNGHVNGVNGYYEHKYDRFSEVPPQIDIPVRGEDGDEVVEFTLQELQDDIDELCDLLESENAAKNYWITIALAYAKQNKVNIAIELLQRALGAQNARPAKPEDKLSIMVCLCWMFLWKCRHAPRVKPTQQTEDDRTKDYFLHQATSILNDASRISPSHPPLNLARGTLYLLRASLQPYKAGNEHSERAETLKQAAKCFDAAYKTSGAKNVMAMLGKARAQFSLGRFAEALALYQQTLEKAPDMLDPDPRIGVGCCLWQLGYKNHAKSAWQRSLDLNENSKIAHVLLGLCYLDESGQYPTTDPEFAKLYKKAMTEHTQTAFKLDAMNAMTCAVFGSYFVLRKAWANVERLARRAIEQTDVNAVASDGWYLLARKEHYEGDMAKAADYYLKADQARGGDERGHLPAKFGAAQLKTLMKDFDGAKFRLEKMISSAGQNQKNLEAMTLLGILYAEDVFANQAAGGKEDKSAEHKKAIGLLEQVRVAWKDPKRKASPDSAVLLNLARLYEQDAPERALACLQQVEKMEIDEIADDDERLPDEMGDAQEEQRAKRELLSPQLLNNIGCFHFQASQYTQAREDFQTALNSCVKMGERDEAVDTDALVTSISYNLARTYEAEGLYDEARKVYQGLLERHPDYIDANSRLAYISLNSEPEAGAKAVKELLDSDPANLEVRALYGWYLNKHKKRTNQLNEDQEQRHYKHTLQNYDKHDLYALTGMGNLHLQVAREMRRETDQDKERRSKTYMRAVEFFDKVLTLDPKNAFAAQGLGIAMVEDKRDTAAGIQVFSKVRESLKGASASVHINLGHVFAETRQWSRSIENYEMALTKSIKDTGKADAQILACLGRVWLMRGRQEKKLEAYKTALDMSKQALELAKDNISFRFNVAFVQIQLATLLAGLPESQRTLLDVEESGAGLEEAIDAFSEIAKNPNAPFPRGDLEARANMGRNTMRKQLSAALEKQKEYETKNASRIAEAKRKREEEIARREEEKRKAAAEADEQRRRIAEERERIAEEDRALIRRRMEEEKAREEAEYTTDAETGERKKREKKPKEKRQKRKKKGDDSDSDGLGLDSDVDGGGATKKGRKSRATSTPATGDDEEAPRRKKKRKLERKGQAQKSNSKFKSSEMVEDSSEDENDGGVAAPGGGGGGSQVETPGAGAVDEDLEMVDEEEEDGEAVAKPQRKRGNRVVDDEDEEEEEDGETGVSAPAVGGEEEEEDGE